MRITTLWLVPCLALLAVCVVLVVLRRIDPATASGPGQPRFWGSAMNVAYVVSFIRVMILWYVTYREWSHNESLSELPLMVLLLPELLLMPGGRSTPATMWISTGLLVAGSFGMVSGLAWLVGKWKQSGSSGGPP